MTRDEYNKAIQCAIDEFDSKTHTIQREYALSRNLYDAGDMITDPIGSIEVERIGVKLVTIDPECWNTTDSTPSCIYSGPMLKKDGTARKDGKKRKVYQKDVI
jgi:hypothetical protein